MSDNTPQLPQELQKELNEITAQNVKNNDAVKIFIGIPNMSTLNVGLITKLFAWARNKDIMPWYHFATEKRHTDYARNLLALEFLKSGCEYLGMIDADCDPHPEYINLYKLGKPIASAVVDCWIAGELIPSVWERSECEQCIVLKKYMETGEIHDTSQYDERNGILYRWNPDNFSYVPFATREGMLPALKCRCGGTGKDPFVFRTHSKQFSGERILKVDSVGSAAMMIHRSVFDKLTMPYFRFYYKPSCEIMMTEDHYFCWKASMVGIDTYADMGLQCSHYKSVDLSGIKRKMIKVFEAGQTQPLPEKPKQEYKIILPTVEEVSIANASKKFD